MKKITLKDKIEFSFYTLLLLIATAYLVCAFIPSLHIDKEETTKVLQISGYKNVEIVGWGAFKGEKGDWYSTEFKAISPSGIPCSGTVTSGLWFKSNTIRLD